MNTIPESTIQQIIHWDFASNKQVEVTGHYGAEGIQQVFFKKNRTKKYKMRFLGVQSFDGYKRDTHLIPFLNSLGLTEGTDFAVVEGEDQGQKVKWVVMQAG